MTRLVELFVAANAIAGIAAFMGVRFVWRRSKNKAKRGFEIIHMDREDDEWNDGGTKSGKELPEVPSGVGSSPERR